jgi:hypothetical protein
MSVSVTQTMVFNIEEDNSHASPISSVFCDSTDDIMI